MSLDTEPWTPDTWPPRGSMVKESRPILFPSESCAIMGACFNVCSELGAGFLEQVYHEALSLELTARKMPFTSRAPLSITYQGTVLHRGNAADFPLDDRIILEVKAASCLCEAHWAQTMSCLKAAKMDLGILVNFGSYPKPEYKRIAAGTGRYGG